jgi:inner membrane protein
LDNVTHSLAGMLLAEVLCTARRESRPELRQAAYLLSALANNLPDIDVVYSSWLTGPRPLGSLIHHRGHTHTLLFALPAAWLLYWVSLRLWRRRERVFSTSESRVLLGLALAGPLLHLLMDLGNNYGVHPFWPLSGRWFYGDTVFIIEPLWLALTIPLIAHQLRRRWLALLLWIILGTLLVVCWFVPLVLPASRYVLVALTLAGVALTRWGTPVARVSFAVVGCLAVALVFRWGSARAQSAAHAASAASFPALAVVDIAASPMPANPACWEALLAGEQAGQYRVLRAKVALPPLSLDECPAGADNAPTAQIRRLDRPERAGVRLQSEFQMPVAELRRLREHDCRFRALLQFTRLPYAQRAPGIGSGPERLQAGDLRYDRSPDRDFSDLEVPLAVPAGGCPRFVTGWREPIADMLGR